MPVTTRTPRPEERNGVDYTFLSKDEFAALEKSGKLLESGIYYGKFQHCTITDHWNHKSQSLNVGLILALIRPSLLAELAGFCHFVFLMTSSTLHDGHSFSQGY